MSEVCCLALTLNWAGYLYKKSKAAAAALCSNRWLLHSGSTTDHGQLQQVITVVTGARGISRSLLATSPAYHTTRDFSVSVALTPPAPPHAHLQQVSCPASMHRYKTAAKASQQDILSKQLAKPAVTQYQQHLLPVMGVVCSMIPSHVPATCNGRSTLLTPVQFAGCGCVEMRTALPCHLKAALQTNVSACVTRHAMAVGSLLQTHHS